MSLTPEEAIAIVIKEKELNKAVLAAKTSLKADEGDAKLQKKYDSAKAKYKAVYAEAVTARKLLKAIKAAAPPEPKTSKVRTQLTLPPVQTVTTALNKSLCAQAERTTYV
jgi:hypothetical protein